MIFHNRNLTSNVKEVFKIKLVYASNPGHLLHISHPHPLDQRGLADDNRNFCRLISES